jgi:hypothetical protein
MDDDDFNIRLKNKWEEANKEPDEEDGDDAQLQKEQGPEEIFKRQLKEKVDNLSMDQLMQMAHQWQINQ